MRGVHFGEDCCVGVRRGISVVEGRRGVLQTALRWTDTWGSSGLAGVGGAWVGLEWGPGGLEESQRHFGMDSV